MSRIPLPGLPGAPASLTKGPLPALGDVVAGLAPFASAVKAADLGFRAELLSLLRRGDDAAIDAAVALAAPHVDRDDDIIVEAINEAPGIPAAVRQRFKGRLMANIQQARLRDGRERDDAMALLWGLFLGGAPADEREADVALRRSRVFEVDAEVLEEVIARAEIADLRSPYLLAPFPYFCVVPAQQVGLAGPEGLSADILSLWIDATTDEWIVYARVRWARDGKPMPSVVVRRGLDLRHGEVTSAADPRLASRADGVANLVASKDPHLADLAGTLVREYLEGGPTAARTPLVKLAVGFCLALNSRSVSVEPCDPELPPVPDGEIDGDSPRRRRPRYRIVIADRRTLGQHVVDARRGRNTVNRRPHWVRQHLRQLADGRIVSVVRHARCGDPAHYLPLYHLRALPDPAVPSQA